MANRVSMVSVEETLKRYLADALVRDIMNDIANDALIEKGSEVGMTYGEWKTRFDDDFSIVWAADSLGGFGKAGWTVYGNADDLRIVKIVSNGSKKVLHLWDDSWGDWRKAKTRYKVVSGGYDYDTGRFEYERSGSYDLDTFADLGDIAYNDGYRDYKIYRYDGTSTDGKDIWVLAGMS